MGNKDASKNIYAVPGLDYVAQEDILPYSISPNDRRPLRHELFDKFLTPATDGNRRFEASETLYAWHLKNHPWLELSEVHREITENIRVTVIPFYVRCDMKLAWLELNMLFSDTNNCEQFFLDGM